MRIIGREITSFENDLNTSNLNRSIDFGAIHNSYDVLSIRLSKFISFVSSEETNIQITVSFCSFPKWDRTSTEHFT